MAALYARRRVRATIVVGQSYDADGEFPDQFGGNGNRGKQSRRSDRACRLRSTTPFAARFPARRQLFNQTARRPRHLPALRVGAGSANAAIDNGTATANHHHQPGGDDDDDYFECSNPSVFGQTVTLTATVSVIARAAERRPEPFNFVTAGGDYGLHRGYFVRRQAQCHDQHTHRRQSYDYGDYSGDTNFTGGTSAGDLRRPSTKPTR